MASRPAIQLLITDVDNTLYDWVRSWATAVTGMIDALQRQLGEPAEHVEERIRRVHKEWGATECPACARALAPDSWEDVAHKYDAAFVASAPVFDGVFETLARVRDAGARVVAYTEAPGCFTRRRLALLGLDRAIDRLYARADEACWSYEPQPSDGVIPIARGRLKPDPEVLHAIAADAGVPHSRVLYVGDNLWKDVSMAQRARVHAAWARYGTERRSGDEALMTRLCHWTPQETTSEREAASAVRPAIVLERRLDELFHLFSFTR